MINIPGYWIENQIYKGCKSTVFRGRRDTDDRPIVIKILNDEYPPLAELSRFKREYEITRNLQSDDIITVYCLEKLNNSLMIVMEDFGGESVASILRNQHLTLLESLSLAVRMTTAIMHTHQQNIIHKDINPTNFVWNPDTDELKIIDYGIATELATEKTQFLNLDVLEGTLFYISPEQTGRMNRSIDYRTDLYSLGVTFYELFTGSLPFQGKTELEIVYSHMATQPISPVQKNPEIPQALSAIIMKLLSKNSEKRYQTAMGLLEDLRNCIIQLKTKGTIDNFKPGSKDTSNRFEIPQKLYGRDKELKQIAHTFNTHTGLLLVAGYSGIGKSSLIYEIQKQNFSKKGRFLVGKFEQLEKNTPYYALIQAFSGLIRQLLTESHDSLEAWKKKLLEALHPNAGILNSLIPGLDQIIGQHPLPVQLNPTENQNRFKLIIRDFIKVFAQPEHPLVIFLDDLQWSDLSTLELLKSLLRTGKIENVLFIGAYRDNEVGAGHPLLHSLAELQSREKPLLYHKLILEPLSEEVLNCLIADTLHCPVQKTKALTNLIFRKTKGNPFFTNQLMYSLYRQGTFHFKKEKGCWEWKQQEIEEVEMSDNVIEFLTKRLQTLPEATIEVLKTASCLGDHFALNKLAGVMKKPLPSLVEATWTAIEEDIIVPLTKDYRLIRLLQKNTDLSEINVNFRFNHDRIQQAVYTLIPALEKKQLHLKLGRLYQQSGEKENIFETVNQLNLGKDLISSLHERAELASLNIKAGKKAKNSAAFTVAATYFETAIKLLSEKEWAEDPEQYFILSFDHTESTLQSGNLQEARKLCDDLYNRAPDNLARGKAYTLKAKILEIQGEKRETVLTILRTALALLDIKLPENHSEIDRMVQEGIGKMQQHLKKVAIPDLVNLPELKDKKAILIMDLMLQAIPAAIQYYFPLFVLIQLMMFDLSLNRGITAVSAKTFIDCGIIRGSMLGDYESAYQLGKAAFAVVDRFKAVTLKPAVYFIFCNFISQWKTHYQEGFAYFDLVYKTAMETGDLQYAGYALAHKIHRLLYTGTNLEICRQEAEKALVQLTDLQAVVTQFLVRIILHFIEKLRGLPDELQSQDPRNEEELMLAKIQESNNLFHLCAFGQMNVMQNYIFGNGEQTEKWLAFTEPYNEGGTGHFSIPDHFLYQGLHLVQRWKTAAETEKEQIMQTLQENQGKLAQWAENCPENFLHKYYLLTAEMAVLENKPLEMIIDLYKKAHTAIGKDDFIHMKALLNECQGAFWLAQGQTTIAKSFIKEAYYLYKQWGSQNKLKVLESRYPQFFIVYNQQPVKMSESQRTKLISLDIASIIKAYQAISREIEIEKLLKVLMHTIVENAGARKGFLLLKHEEDSRFYVEAIKAIHSEEIKIMNPLPLKDNLNLCKEIIQYVARTKKSVVLGNACYNSDFHAIPYIAGNRIKSVLCTPIIYQNNIKGIVYLENNLAENVFTLERIEFIKILSSQASISIENARLYQNLGEKVRERTAQLLEANAKLKRQSLIDPLTNLYNRRCLYEMTSDLTLNFIKTKLYRGNFTEKRDLSPHNKVCGIFLIDLDFFKKINDTYGHEAGDKVLVNISRVLKEMIRTDDIVIRYGGEEFLIILNNTQPGYLPRFSKRVLNNVKGTPVEVAPQKVMSITCSIGCASIPAQCKNPHLLSLEQTINLSDYALYMAKEKGRDRAVHIELKNQHRINENTKKYLLSLSKYTSLDPETISLRFIK